ncbi:mechanosensitive ion channel [Vaginisenegalia massiliensis]|uniref:mechanosensitive ion channel n=1 Tax=Vaginisenegalia massiliensis TaxID=2058294 RepID=UPI000F536F14|nr:mechanosensitive ion channel [Vaginisenegalia massiliensis]
MSQWNELISSFSRELPGVLGAVLILIVAVILATIAKKSLGRLLRKLSFDQNLIKWGMAKNDQESDVYIDTIGSILYFVIILFFLPVVLSGLNVGGVMDPIVNMFNKFLSYIPNLVAAIIILVVGSYFCKFVKSLVQNILETMKVDRWFDKITGAQDSIEKSELSMAEVLASVVYVLIFIPILTVSLETMGIKSISVPIVGVLNQVLSTIPNIFVAIVLLIVGSFIAKLIGDLIESLLATSGIDQYSKHLNFKGQSVIRISNVTAQILRGVLMIFFIVEALSVLKLEVLNNIGNAIIAYMPLLLSAFIILALGVIGGNILGSFLSEVSGSKLFGEFVRYGLIILSVFMTLDQLKFAQTIVSTGFVLILGSISFAFALAFGLGGRDFAAKQLERIDHALNEDSSQRNQND